MLARVRRLVLCILVTSIVGPSAMAGDSGALVEKSLLSHINTAGYFAEPMMGRHVPCPCISLGVASVNGEYRVYISSNKRTWWMFSCVKLQEESGWMCREPESINIGAFMLSPVH